MVLSSQRGTEENGDKKNTLSKSSIFQQRTVASKPLCKHTFYLDVKSRTIVSRIEGKIRALGGNIELFLDKDVTHIITDKEIPTSNKEDVRSPFTSTLFGGSKSFDSQKGGNGGERTPNHVTRHLKTRVSAMLEKARGIPSYIEKDIFAEASRLSITVWTIEKALTWLNKVSLSLKPSSRHGHSNNRYNFRCKYYIKFEAFDRTTRPVFRELISWPHVNVCGGAAAGDGGLVTTVVAPATPLEAPEPVPHRNMTRGVGRYGPTAAAATNSNVINVLHPFSANATLKPTSISFPGVTLTAGNVFTPGIISKVQDDIQSPATKTTPHPTILNLNVRLNRRLSSLNQSSNRKTGTKPQEVLTPKLGRSTPKKANTVKDNIPGYCELCRLNFANQPEHFVSEGHLKFVGDSKNYTEIDELIGKTAVEEFLKANNYQSVTSQELYTANNSTETAAMTSTRGSHRVSATDIAPPAGVTARYGGGTSTRPRRHTTFNNSYLEISVDDDMMKPPECAREMRETRGTRHSQTKPADPESDTYWTSGRPKRACIQRKLSSSDDKPIPNNQTYYRVEVLSNKLRSNTTEATNTNSNSIHNKHYNEATPTCVNTVDRKANSREQNGGEGERLTTPSEDKGLIVKFRRLRNSELKQLNNEAVNFLFPRKDDSSSEEDIDDNCPNTTATSSKAAEISVVISSEDDETVEEINETDTKEQIRTNKKKEETDTDENHSVDSNWSDCNTKKNQNHKRRRTHAEAFINDNQKYYKFETTGSRLRYQGTFMSTHDVNIEKQIRPRLNGENPIDMEDNIVYSEEDLEDKPQPKKLKLDDVKYSYELRPASEPWYQTFVRQDQGLEDYSYHKSFSELGYYRPFYLPHQLPPLQPLDPRVCFTAYDRLKRFILEEAGIISLDPTPCSSTGNSTPTNNTQQIPDANAREATAQHQHQLNRQEDHSDDIKRLDVNSHAGSSSDSEGGSGSNGASPFGDEDGDFITGDLEGGSSNSNNSNKEGRESLEVDEDAGCGRKKEREKDVETTNSTKMDLEQRRQQRRRQKRLLKAGTCSGRSPGRNARKSPRQHASTLAILSLLQQRKRREMNRSKSNLENSIVTDSNNLDPTREENFTSSQSLVLATQHSMTAPSTSIEPQSAEANELAMLLSTIDCMDAAIAAETIDIDKFHVDIVLNDAETLLQSYSKTDAIAILEDYEKHKEMSKTGLSHGANKRSYSPGKKPGRKRKKKRKNMTGWPNVVKKTSTNNIKKDMDGSTIDSLSITADSEELDDTNDVSLATLAADSTDLMHLKFDVDEEDDMKMPLSNLSDLQSRRSPAPKSPTNRNNSVNSRSSANSEKLGEKTRNKHFSKQLKDNKNLNESVSNYSSANHCIYNNISDNNIGTNNTSNNRVNVNEEMFSENDIEDSLTYCNNTNSRETRIIDLSHHWRERDKATRTAETNSKSATHAAQFQPVVRVEKMNNRQLRSSVVSPSTKGSALARGNSVSKSPTRSVSMTRSNTSGSPSRSLSNSRGDSKQRASARRMPASPRSPRVLRKPRGRWYRDR